MPKTIILLLTMCMVLFGCYRTSNEDEIQLPANPPLSRPVIGYGVINTNYTHVMDNRGDGRSIGLLRKGAIVEVIERRPVLNGETAESWVLADGNYRGWLREDELRIYPSMAQAQTASEGLPK
ncbi:hypothetical protein FACS189494_00570 [Spirochaetia bacterium]|nr:hypothetical protein FACS189494_00570 [Spirochaetia bacterium]